jgi:hypothetical protein
MESPALDETRVAELAIDFCSACSLFMGRIIEAERNDIHACLKVIVRGKDGTGDRIKALARSEPNDGREIGGEGTPLAKNTAWNVFCGTYDGCTKWPKMSCFCCNDLRQHVSDYDNGRDRWDQFYESKLIFPLRYMNRRDPSAYETIGFLEFDSKKGAFIGMPNAYDFVKKANEYRTEAENNAIFHAGAIIADTLSMCLRPFYEYRAGERENKQLKQ